MYSHYTSVDFCSLTFVFTRISNGFPPFLCGVKVGRNAVTEFFAVPRDAVPIYLSSPSFYSPRKWVSTFHGTHSSSLLLILSLDLIFYKVHVIGEAFSSLQSSRRFAITISYVQATRRTENPAVVYKPPEKKEVV
jgi:hypothetical protein